MWTWTMDNVNVESGEADTQPKTHCILDIHNDNTEYQYQYEYVRDIIEIQIPNWVYNYNTITNIINIYMY